MLALQTNRFCLAQQSTGQLSWPACAGCEGRSWASLPQHRAGPHHGPRRMGFRKDLGLGTMEKEFRVLEDACAAPWLVHGASQRESQPTLCTQGCASPLNNTTHPTPRVPPLLQCLLHNALHGGGILGVAHNCNRMQSLMQGLWGRGALATQQKEARAEPPNKPWAQNRTHELGCPAEPPGRAVG